MTQKVNPQIQQFLDQFNAFMLAQPKQIPVDAGRLAYEHFSIMQSGIPLRLRRVEDLTIPVSNGSTYIPIRIYTPQVGTQLPALIYYHGGGWQRGSITTHDSICRNLAVKANCLVMSVEWRLAPEHKFPIGLEDCWDAYHWLLEHGPAEYNVDLNRIAIGGDSAGGNMTAVTIQRLKQENKQLPKFQLLLYAALDLGCSLPSYDTYADGYFLSAEHVQYYVDHYLNSREEVDDPRASPLRAKDLSGLPATHVVTAGFDPLRSEGQAYYEKLKQFGVPVTYQCYKSMIHAFLHMTGTVPEVNQIIDEIAARLKEGLNA
jgi:acetyl esterase